MQQSLKILTDVPDYADRVAHLETLKNRLEALVSPSIIVSFNNQDVGKKMISSKFSFQKIEMRKSYSKKRRDHMLKYFNRSTELNNSKIYTLRLSK